MAQLRDLIVTGAARFLNNIYGNLIGNATSSDKVNHKLTINVDNQIKQFDGSSDQVVNIDMSTLNMSDIIRLIGSVDNNFTVFTDGDDEMGGIVTNNTTVTNAGITQHVIFLSQVLSSDCNSTTVTIGGGQAIYYTPRVGDMVLQKDQEYICVAASNTQSKWRAMDSSGYWGTY